MLTIDTGQQNDQDNHALAALVGQSTEDRHSELEIQHAIHKKKNVLPIPLNLVS
jgi:hypothetical protein